MKARKLRPVRKKAMSPLFSTIILIGFAIALGGILMSWGKTGYAMEESDLECGKISMSLISYGENNGICSRENRLYFTIHNNGELDLDGMMVSVLGGEEVYSEIIYRRIKVADIVKLEMGYQNSDKIEKVIFTPRFTYAERERLCPKNGFSIENIGEC